MENKKSGLLVKAEKINRKRKAVSVLAIIFGLICIAYDVILICLCPGTFMDIVISFSHIWSVLGIYHIFVGIYRIKKNHSFFETWKKWIKLTIVSLFTLGVLISASSLYFILTPVLASENEPVDYVILLGGGIDKNGKLPRSVQKRVEKCGEFMNNHPDAICVVTGGTLRFLPVAEAPELKRYLVEQGIPAEQVLMEDQALDTIQNFQLSCQMLAEHENKTQKEILDSRIAVITSYFHLRRAERLAARMGFTSIKGVGTKIPYINVPHTYVREICAYIKLNLRILLTGKPEKIQ